MQALGGCSARCVHRAFCGGLRGPAVHVPDGYRDTEFTNVFTDIERTDTLRTKEERDEIIAEMQAQAESQVSQTSERIERR